MQITISEHAIRRFQERVDPTATHDAAYAALNSPAIQRAADFGARHVRLASNHRVVIHDHTVITVLPASHYRKQICRQNIAPQVRGPFQHKGVEE